MHHITVDICTKDRYTTTLPLTLMSIATQTYSPNEVVIYDDSINRMDMRENEILNHIFHIFDSINIKWRVIFGHRRGQHIGHQIIQKQATDLVWRIDDDCVAEGNVLKELLKLVQDPRIGAVAGLVLAPNAITRECPPNTIASINDNCQWYKWVGTKENNEHLYSSFLYKKGIQDFDINLSPVAHREETLFSYGLFKKGYKLLVTGEVITHHLRANTGGIRTGKPEDWAHDEIAFQETLREYEGHKVCFLNNGMGDHLVFKSILPKIKERYKNITLAVCYPDLFPDEKTISIAEGLKLCNPEKHNIYKWCIDHNWQKELKYAYAEMYGVKVE